MTTERLHWSDLALSALTDVTLMTVVEKWGDFNLLNFSTHIFLSWSGDLKWQPSNDKSTPETPKQQYFSSGVIFSIKGRSGLQFVFFSANHAGTVSLCCLFFVFGSFRFRLRICLVTAKRNALQQRAWVGLVWWNSEVRTHKVFKIDVNTCLSLSFASSYSLYFHIFLHILHGCAR